VLGYNAGYANPIGAVIDAWQASPVHDGILSDRGYGRIGCAERSTNGEHWFVCVLATGGSTGLAQAGGGSGGGGGGFIPDTAMAPPD
jgi:hypothetical protein